MIRDVTRGSPADKAGLKPGDVLRKFNGQTVNEADDLLAMVATSNPGTTVTLEILRNGEQMTKQVTLEQRPASLGYGTGGRRPAIEGPLRGVAVQNLTPTLRQQLQLPAEVHGVVVTNVDPESPAARSLEEGHVIISINRQEVNSVADFNKLATEAHGKVLLRIIRHGEAVFVVVSSGENDEQ